MDEWVRTLLVISTLRCVGLSGWLCLFRLLDLWKRGAVALKEDFHVDASDDALSDHQDAGRVVRELLLHHYGLPWLRRVLQLVWTG